MSARGNFIVNTWVGRMRDWAKSGNIEMTYFQTGNDAMVIPQRLWIFSSKKGCGPFSCLKVGVGVVEVSGFSVAPAR